MAFFKIKTNAPAERAIKKKIPSRNIVFTYIWIDPASFIEIRDMVATSFGRFHMESPCWRSLCGLLNGFQLLFFPLDFERMSENTQLSTEQENPYYHIMPLDSSLLVVPGGNLYDAWGNSAWVKLLLGATG